MGQIKQRDAFRSQFFSVLRKVEIEIDQVPLFFAHIQQKLEDFGWKKTQETYNEQESDTIPLVKSEDLHEMAGLEVFIKNPWQLLTVGMKVSNSGVHVAWDQRLHPRLAKILGSITAGTLCLASILRLIFPLGNLIPLLVFIFGTLFSLGVIIYAMYRFEKSINKQDDIGIAFLDAVLKYEGEKLISKKQTVNLP